MKKVEKTTLYFKWEFEDDEGVWGGKVSLTEAGTPIKREGRLETFESKDLGWMYEPEARKLAKSNGWEFQSI